jgi:hypothetical protein
MNYYLENHDISLILDALENYRLYIEMEGLNCKNVPWDVHDIDNLMDELEIQDD